MLRLKCANTAEVVDCASAPALSETRKGAIVIGRDVTRLAFDRGVKPGDRILMPAACGGDNAEIEHDRRIVGCARQGGLVSRFRLGEPASLIMRSRQCRQAGHILCALAAPALAVLLRRHDPVLHIGFVAATAPWRELIFLRTLDSVKLTAADPDPCLPLFCQWRCDNGVLQWNSIIRLRSRCRLSKHGRY